MTPDRAVSARRAWAEIDLDAIADNLRAAALLARPARVMAVVKADGYGHGAVAVARTAAAAGAAALGVATVDEGLALREAAIDLPIVVLGPARGEEEAAFAADLALTVVDEEGGRAAAEAARKRGVAGGVHLKVDTGMTRLGVDPGALPLLLEQMAGWADLRVDGVFTHLAAADSDPEFTREQVALFGSAAALVRARFPDALRHAAATAGLFTLPAARFDMVRLGLGLYGLYPAPDLRAAAPLRPAMTLWSRVVQVRPVAAGATVSYGRTHRVLSATRIATVAIGYADGYPRVLGGRARMRLGDRFYPVVGRVTMDYTMLDVGDGPAAAGDVVQVFGPDLPADEVATQASTISYEIVTRIGPRVPRIYRAGGAIAGVRDARGAAGIALPTPLPAPSRPR